MYPNGSSRSSPLQYRKSEGFSISSYLQLNCSSSLSTITQWTITICTQNCSVQINLTKTIVTTLSELFIPATTLDYGTYQLELTVKMSSAPHLNSSKMVYVSIVPSTISANLIPFGTSMITQGYQQRLTFNPGKYSIDPDASLFNTSVCFVLFHVIVYGCVTCLLSFIL